MSYENDDYGLNFDDLTNAEKARVTANISEDLAELNDLKKLEPEKYAELLREWAKFSNEIKAKRPTAKVDE